MVTLKLRANMRRLDRTPDGAKKDAIYDSIEKNNDRLQSLHIDLRASMEKYLRFHPVDGVI